MAGVDAAAGGAGGSGVTRADAGTVVTELSYQLLDLAAEDEFIYAASSMLAVLIPSQGVAWSHLDLATGTAQLRGTPTELQTEPVRDLLAAHAGDHPIIQSYLRTDVAVGAPRRLSDVASRRDLLRTGSYVEVMRPLQIHHQLSIMITRQGALTGSGWAVSRDRHDFTDDELAICGPVQQVLSMMTRRPVSHVPPPKEVVERTGLTPREQQVLCLVAEGHTAQRIGRVLRIAPATVRKHLERVYAKLGAHDRLLAVERARALGLLARPHCVQPANL